MTLFAAVSPGPEFAAAIGKFYGGTPDQQTLELLGGRRRMFAPIATDTSITAAWQVDRPAR